LIISQLTQPETTKLTLKYPPLAIKESVVVHTCIFNKIVLVVVVVQLFVQEAGNHHVRVGFVVTIGGVNIQSQVHQEVVIINQLKFI
jgi:hypothetical protein